MTAVKFCTEANVLARLIILARLMDSRAKEIILLSKPDCLCNTDHANLNWFRDDHVEVHPILIGKITPWNFKVLFHWLITTSIKKCVACLGCIHTASTSLLGHAVHRTPLHYLSIEPSSLCLLFPKRHPVCIQRHWEVENAPVFLVVCSNG